MNLLLLLPLAFSFNTNDPSAREAVCTLPDAPAGGLPGSASEEWSLTLAAGERAYILVEGSGASDLDAALIDASGKVVAADEGLADFCLLSIEPLATELYTLRVTNRGSSANVYDIRVETPRAGVLQQALAWLRLHVEKHQHVAAYRSRLVAQAVLFFVVPGRSPAESRRAVEGLLELFAHQAVPPKPAAVQADSAAGEEEFLTCSLESCSVGPL